MLVTTSVRCELAAAMLLCTCAASASLLPTGICLPLAEGQSDAEVLDGEVKTYSIALPAGQAIDLRLRQLDIGSVALQIQPEGDAEPLRLQTDFGRDSGLTITLLADAAPRALSRWRVRVAAVRSDAPTKFSIALAEAHAVTASDRERRRAAESLATAEALRRTGERSNLASALDSYDAAATHAAAANAPCMVRDAYAGAAAFQMSLSNYPASQASAESALALSCDEEPAGRISALRTFAVDRANQGDFAGARLPLERALDLLWRTGDSRLMGQYQGTLSIIYSTAGEQARALQTAKSALANSLAANDLKYVANARRAIADIHLHRGELTTALDTYRQVLDDLKSAPFPLLEGVVLSNMATIYDDLGDPVQAGAANAAAEALCRRIEDWNCVGEEVLARGTAELEAGSLPAAEATYRQALKLAANNSLDGIDEQALRQLGRVRMASQNWDEAREFLQKALKQAQTNHVSLGEAQIDAALGDLDSTQQHLAAARDDYQRSLDLVRASDNLPEQVIALAGLARVARDGNALLPARGYIEQALNLIESERAQISEPDLRTGYFSSKRAYYDLYVDILMRLEHQHPKLGNAAAALEAAERARARSLQDLLRERGIAVDAQVAPSLLAQAHAAEDQLRAAAYRQTNSSGQNAGALQTELDAASAQLDRARGAIRSADLRYAEVSHPQKLGVDEIQHTLLDDDAVLLEYWLGEKRSYLWVLRPNALQSFELPARAQIEPLVRTLREKILARAPANVPMAQLAQVEADQLREIVEGSYQLREILLPAAARAAMQHQHQLVVVADGDTQLLPFGLIDSLAMSAATDANSSTSFAASHAIAYLPSIATLRWLRRAAPVRAPSVALFADPIFRADDPRLPRVDRPEPAHPQTPADSAQSRAADGVALTGLPRLPHSREEAEAVAKLFPPDRTWLALGFAANRENALAMPWPEGGILHFATHAMLDLRHPDLSGVVLSLFDANGTPRDGILRMNDIYALKLHADLVVLSACESALGKEIAAEGAYGLARAFFYAGTPRVLGSLWTVDDRASAEFMRRFYTELLKASTKPAEALRRAQSQMAADPQWHLPYWWAGYVLQGDWQ